MTYDEIEAFLREHRCNATIERLREAVGQEAEDIRKGSTGFETNPDQCLMHAREYYAEDISRWMNIGGELDPDIVPGVRQRYTHSWAFAQIIVRLQRETAVVADDQNQEEDAWIDQMMARLCAANAGLGERVVELIGELREHQRQRLLYNPADAEALQRIREALDVAKAPTLNELGNRKLEVWERVEALCAQLKERS